MTRRIEDQAMREKIVLGDSRATIKNNNTYNKRLKIVLSAIAFIGFIATSIYFWNIWLRHESDYVGRLETYTTLRTEAIERFLKSLNQETLLWSSQPEIIVRFKEYNTVWDELTPQERVRVRKGYIKDGSPKIVPESYRSLHDLTQPKLEAFMTHHGYYDVFFFNVRGDLIYTVVKEDDYGLNFSKKNGGKYKDSGLGQVFQKAYNNLDKNKVSFVDFEPYAPSFGDTASFLSRTVYDENGQRIGVFAIQVPFDKFNTIIQYSSGLGKTGETNLIGADLLLRNQSRLVEEDTINKLKLDAPAVKEALKGEKATLKGKNAKGENAIIVSAPLEFNGTKWAVATEMEMSEIREPMQPYIIFYVLTIIFLAMIAYISYYLLRAKSTPKPTLI